MEYTWSGRKLTRKQTTSRPDILWPEIWQDMSEAPKRKEKHKWSIEKPNLDNARKMRGIYFIDPDDGEFQDIMKNARRKADVPMPATMPCKIQREKYRETSRVEKDCKTKYACIVEADESTRKRMEGSLHKNHEGHIAGKGMNSLSRYNLVHKFVPMPQALRIPDTKAAAEKEWEKEVIAEARNDGRTVHFASIMNLCRLKNSELEPQFQKYKGRIVLRSDSVKDDSGSSAVFTDQGSSASQMTAATVTDIVTMLPGCAGQAADAISANTQVKIDDAPSLFKIPKTDCPDIWIRLQKRKWPGWKIQSFLLGEICTVIHLQNYFGKSYSRKFFWSTVGKKFQNGNS